MSAEDPRGHLATRLDGQSFDDHERQRPEEHHERSHRKGSAAVASSIGRLVEEAELFGSTAAFLRRRDGRVPRRRPTSIRFSRRPSRRGAEGRSPRPDSHTSEATPSGGHRISRTEHDLAGAPGGPDDEGDGVDADIGAGVGGVDHGAVADVDADVIGVVTALPKNTRSPGTRSLRATWGSSCHWSFATRGTTTPASP